MTPTLAIKLVLLICKQNITVFFQKIVQIFYSGIIKLLIRLYFIKLDSCVSQFRLTFNFSFFLGLEKLSHINYT